MAEKPNFLVSGDPARLFPVLAETSKEKRVASIFLAVLTQIPALAEEALSSAGLRLGKRAKVRAYTEVVLKEKVEGGCRPDGLLVVETGRSRWCALIEAKIGNAGLQSEQVQRYLELARTNGVDAVITISNEFVAKAEHSPVAVPKTLLRKTALYHWSWPWLATVCEVLAQKGAVEDAEQSFLLDQLKYFFAHPGTGIERHTQMAPSWRDVVQAVSNGEKINKNAPDVEAAAASWLAEERDLGLHLSSHVGCEVEARIERRFGSDAAGRLKETMSALADTLSLSCALRVPDCASDIEVCADLTRRTVTVSMKLKAPTDRKSTKARVNWLLRMLPDNDPRLLVRAQWPGRGAPTTKDLASLRSDPGSIQAANHSMVPHGFEVTLVEDLGKRFAGRKTFIEDLERIVLTFYDLVGVHLKAWQAPPPKPVRPIISQDQSDPDVLEQEAAPVLENVA